MLLTASTGSLKRLKQASLGGSWVVVSRVVISRLTILITPIRGLITLLITTHEAPSKYAGNRKVGTWETH